MSTTFGLGLAAAACGGTTGIGLDFEADQGGTRNALTVAPGLEVDRLELQLREIKILRDEQGDDGTTEAKARGTFLVNVLDADASRVPAIEVEPGLYKKVEFKIDKPNGGQGIDGSDASVWFEGTKDGARFRFLGESTEKITLRNVDGIQLIEGEAEDFMVDLRVSTWLDGVDLSRLEATEGVVVIAKDGANRAAYDSVRGKLREAIKILRKPAR